MAESGSMALPGAENVEEPGEEAAGEKKVARGEHEIAEGSEEEADAMNKEKKPPEHYAREVARQVKPIQTELAKVKAENERLRLDYARAEA
ncbi:MAG: hypothetical protein AAB368_08555, partial [bacterium]